jgi:1-acyl-sn-glycerol-3-phosphate acyltransferase
MPGDGVGVPRISRPLLDWFTLYSRVYLRRNFHAVRLLKGTAPRDLAGRPVIVVMNHPGWWDPLIGLLLAKHLFPERVHYAPIESEALGRYRFFEKIGLFGVSPGTVRGAAQFLRVGSAVLSDPVAVLWVTAQGTFVDVRKRPVELRSGVGHLVRRLREVTVIPLALEYAFWEERYPEALASFGTPRYIEDVAAFPAAEWTAQFACDLETTQDRLAEAAVARSARSFDVLLGGRTGVGGVYDVWRSLKARWRGERFSAAHRPERL